LKISRSRRIVIVATASILAVGAGGFLFRSLATAGRHSPPFTYPSSWLGEWSGTIDQPDSGVRSWTFSMTLTETQGRIVGSYVESSLDCRGSLTTAYGDPSKLELDEAVTVQPPSGTPWFCGGGPIQIKRTGPRSAIYSWEGGVAHGVIRRQ
jgi:hypothetical protein